MALGACKTVGQGNCSPVAWPAAGRSCQRRWLTEAAATAPWPPRRPARLPTRAPAAPPAPARLPAALAQLPAAWSRAAPAGGRPAAAKAPRRCTATLGQPALQPGQTYTAGQSCRSTPHPPARRRSSPAERAAKAQPQPQRQLGAATAARRRCWGAAGRVAAARRAQTAARAAGATRAAAAQAHGLENSEVCSSGAVWGLLGADGVAQAKARGNRVGRTTQAHGQSGRVHGAAAAGRPQRRPTAACSAPTCAAAKRRAA